MQEIQQRGSERCIDRCKTVGQLVDTVRALRQYNAELEQQASYDDLTGALRRNHFFELSRHQFNLSLRHQRVLSVLMLDTDHFKTINDTYGHEVGDRQLQRIATICRENLRTSDIFGRYGGEEFAITLPETGQAEACLVAERIRSSVEQFSMDDPEHGAIHCTVSIGLATLSHSHFQFGDLLHDADIQMYLAKQDGRNCVAWCDH